MVLRLRIQLLMMEKGSYALQPNQDPRQKWKV